MTALYLIAQEYRFTAAVLADMDIDPQTAADTLEALAGELETKAQAVAFVARSLDADAAAVKQWAKDAVERAKAMEARAESLREYLSRQLQACGVTKVAGPGITIGFRASSDVVIDEPGLIPAEFMKQPDPPPPAPSKTLIGEALKAGREVPGAHLEQRQNLQIK